MSEEREKQLEKKLTKAFRDAPSERASLDGDAAILARILKKWYGDECWRVAQRVEEALRP